MVITSEETIFFPNINFQPTHWGLRSEVATGMLHYQGHVTQVGEQLSKILANIGKNTTGF